MNQSQPKQIMMIDDDVEDIEIFREFVEKCEIPIQVHHSDDCIEGIAMLKSLPEIHVIFVDSQMPKMNGFELIQLIKMDVHLSNIPIVLISSRFSPSDEHRAKNVGAFSCITKSSDYKVYCNELLKVIHNCSN